MTGREQFEAIYMKREPEASMAFNESVGRYKYVFIQSQYEFFLEAWQASREAVEVELPEEMKAREALDKGFMCDYAAGVTDTVVQMRENLRAAGIKVKGG